MAHAPYTRVTVVASLALLAACRAGDDGVWGRGGAPGNAAGATGSSGGSGLAVDAAGAGGSPAADAAGAGGSPAADVSCNACWSGHCVDRNACQAATPVELGVPLAMQDTSTGAYGDCAPSGSSGGERQLYYSLLIPPAGAFSRHVRVTAAPVNPSQDAAIRMLADCDAQVPENAARGGRTTNGAASFCAANPTASTRKVVIAVGHYSNATDGLVFDLSTELIAPDVGCP